VNSILFRERALVFAFLCLLFVSGAYAAALNFPQLTGRVVDEAGILSADTQDKLAQLLAQEEKQTTNQVVVVTLKSLQGQTIEDYGYQLGRHWGIGQKGKNNGTLIIVAPNEHATRIEVAYGLEGVLTDANTRIVIERYMLPAFRRGDYDAGVLAGTNAVLQVLGGVTLSPPQASDSDQDQRDSGGLPWGFIILVLVWLVFGRFLWPLLFLGGLGGFGGRGSGGGFGGGGFGGGGFGGGGFSGGGGSFGGGGASGHW
jgi:uncharacterized protein